MTQKSGLREKTQLGSLKWACKQDQSFDLEVNVYINIFKIMYQEPINVGKIMKLTPLLAFFHNK